MEAPVNSSTFNFKSFITTFLFVYGLGTALFIVGSEMIIRTLVLPTSSFEELREKLHSVKKPYAVFADSHGENAVLENKDIVNLSWRGDNIETIVKKINFYTENNHPRGIILQAAHHQFSSYRIFADQTQIQSDLISKKKYVFEFLRPYYRQYLFEYWKNLRNHLVSAGSSVQSTPPLNFKELTKLGLDEQKYVTSLRVNLHNPVKNFKTTRSAEDYEKILVDLSLKNIQVCMVTFPVSSLYNKLILNETSISEIKKYFELLAEHKNITYLDASTLLNDTYFNDPDHLNQNGAELFTTDILELCFGEQK